MRIAREIRNDFVYIIPLRVSTDPNPDSQGPIPVITFPNANGFVAGLPTHFIRWDPLQARPYVIYRFLNTDLTAWEPVGFPINENTITPGSREFQFEISLNQLADTPADAALLQTLQANFLTMNKVSTVSGTGRVIDALGDTRLPSEINEFVQISLLTPGIYDNVRFGLLEPPSDSPATTDCPEPDLDLVDWAIEIRT
jgi:hypothetical protein